MKTLVTTFAICRGEDSRANSIISAAALAKVSRPRSIYDGSNAITIRLHIYKFHTTEFSIAP